MISSLISKIGFFSKQLKATFVAATLLLVLGSIVFASGNQTAQNTQASRPQSLQNQPAEVSANNLNSSPENLSAAPDISSPSTGDQNSTPLQTSTTTDPISGTIPNSTLTQTLTPTPTPKSWSGAPLNHPNENADLVVVGRVDLCFVCQFGPAPHVSYTQVLFGKAPNGQTNGELSLVGIDDSLLPEGGVPIYKSGQEEIIFLQKVAVVWAQNPDAVAYKVVAIMEATPENLASFD